MRILAYCAAALLLSLPNAAAGAGDAERGARVFGESMGCHSVETGAHMTGPSLAHIWNRKAGTTENFLRYSDAMKRADVTWNEATLDKWLNNPERFLPGTSMTSAGLPVVIGAGMQGDRASVVFAASGEISAFIKPSCSWRDSAPVRAESSGRGESLPRRASAMST